MTIEEVKERLREVWTAIEEELATCEKDRSDLAIELNDILASIDRAVEDTSKTHP